MGCVGNPYVRVPGVPFHRGPTRWHGGCYVCCVGAFSIVHVYLAGSAFWDIDVRVSSFINFGAVVALLRPKACVRAARGL